LLIQLPIGLVKGERKNAEKPSRQPQTAEQRRRATEKKGTSVVHAQSESCASRFPILRGQGDHSRTMAVKRRIQYGKLFRT